MIEKLQKIIEHPDFIALVDEYNPFRGEEGLIPFSQIAAERIQHLSQDRLLVPVLGVQGVGKSSFLNALLMDDMVLPIDADETTCIPVEVIYTDDQEKATTIYYQDGRQRQLQKNEDLDEYVNNAKNPGNEKKTSHAVAESNSPILKNNVVLVDLPGIGSLTKNNMETTMNYIKEITAAIILIRTVPPITQQEKLFLTSIWHKLSSAWFIQNRWMDESRAEVDDGKDYNKKILSDIARKRGDSSQRDIDVVNIYQALKTCQERDEKGYKESGITVIQSRLQEMAANWKKALFVAQLSFLQDLIKNIRHEIEKRKSDNKADKDELSMRYRKNNDEWDEMLRYNRKENREIERVISKIEREIMSLIMKESREKAEKLRAEMRRLTFAGLTDGEHLSNTFEEKQKTLFEELLTVYIDEVWNFENKMKDLVGKFKIRTSEGEMILVGDFFIEEKTKLEKILPLGGCLGGAVIGGKIGLVFGAMIGGPIGVILGFIVWGVVALLGSWLGRKGKQAVTEQRASRTMQELQPHIENFRTNMQDQFTNNLKEITVEMRRGLRWFRESQEEDFEREKAKQDREMKKSQEEKEEFLENLKADLNCLNSFQELIKIAYASIAG